MKRIISLSLVLLMLTALLLTATSCGMESITGYTLLRDHIIDKAGYNKDLELDAQAVGLSSAVLKTVTLEGAGDTEQVELVGTVSDTTYALRLTLTLNGSPEKASLLYEVLVPKLDTATASVTLETAASARATILLTHYTGNDPIEFTSVDKVTVGNENGQRQNATVLLNSLLLALDTYITENLDMNTHDLGFIALSDKYMADVETVEAEEDLGGAFSSARWTKAGLMLLQGMGMVFLVLAILWVVLLIFKAVFYKDPAKEASKAEKPAKTESKEAPAPVAASVAAPAPVPAAPVADDAQLIAVITAAVAAAIESDPALTSQFASGFRVVSFKKTDKSRNR